MKRITIPASQTSRQSAVVAAFKAQHKTLGDGILYRYLSKDKTALVARCFPEEWEKGCQYLRAVQNVSPKAPLEEIKVLMNLMYVQGELSLDTNFNISTVTKLYLMPDMGYSKSGECTFVLERMNKSHKFKLKMDFDEEDPNLLELVQTYLYDWAWKRWPGCSVTPKS